MSVDEGGIQGLRHRLRGELLRPGDGAYEEARKVFNAMIQRRPALIVRCAGAADVIAAVRFAAAVTAWSATPCATEAW